MSHKKTHQTSDFTSQRSILDFRPKINFIEPNQIPDVPPASVETPVTLEVLKTELDQAINDYKDLVTTADIAQKRIDSRSAGLVINLDPLQDAGVINAIQRHFNDPKKETIGYDDYKDCLEDTRKASLSRAFSTNSADILAANNDQFRTSFGSIGKLPGLARPELYNKVQAIKPLDLAKFTEEQLIKLAKELLELLAEGPIGIIGPPIKALIDYLTGQLRTKRTKKDPATDKILSELTDASSQLEPDNYPGKTQDCNLIIDAFERGAHFSDTESSVYAPLSRGVQNTKSFSEGMQVILAGYKSNQLSKSTDSNTAIHDQKQSIKFGKVEVSIPNNEATALLNKAIKDCIPCSFKRIGSFLELNIGTQLLNTIKADLKRRLEALKALGDLLNNVDTYGDFCQMVNFLNFMCVPDLQRILAMLAAMLTNIGFNLSGMMSLLMQLVAPFMTPILMSMNVLLDRFIQLVLEPIDCIINAIDLQVRKLMIQPQVNLGLGKPNFTKTTNSLRAATNINQAKQKIASLEAEAKSGLVQLGNQLDKAQSYVRNKLSFLTKEAEKLLSQAHVKDLGYTGIARDKLVVIRLVGLVKSMINVVSSGKKLCADQAKPSNSEIDNFYQHYVSPSSPFKISVDSDGNLVISEKDNAQTIQRLPTLALAANVTFNPVSTIFKCAIATTSEDIDKVNLWMSQLDKV